MQVKINDFSQNTLAGTPAGKVITQTTKTQNGAQSHNRDNKGSLTIQAHDAASVTISREGRNYQKQASAASMDSLIAASRKAFKAAQEIASNAGKTSTSGASSTGTSSAVSPEADQNRATLDGIKNRFDEIMEDRTPQNTRDSIEEMQRALADIRRMKEYKEECRQRAEKEIQNTSSVSARQQAETEKAKGDLLVMLESIEEQDEQEDAEETQAKEENSDSENGQEDGTKKAANIVQNSATQMKTSLMDKEDISRQSIQTIENKGMRRLDHAQEEYGNFMQEYHVLSRALDDETVSETDKNALVAEYALKAQGEKYRPGGFSEVEMNRKLGLAERQNARDLRREARGVNVMPDIQKIGGTISAALSQEALNGQSQQFLEQAGSELDRRLKEEIKNRNDRTENIEEAKEAEEEKMKEEEKEQKTETPSTADSQKSAGAPKSEDWYTEALEELDEFIESQGIYIRQ